MPEIEHNIPIPKIRRRRKYAFMDAMAVGDSVVVNHRQFWNLEGAAQYRRKRDGKRFKERAIGNDRVRIWRVA
jgi:hypothetical protein